MRQSIQPSQSESVLHSIPQSLQEDFFCFLKNGDVQRPKSFFSEKGLLQDIIDVTNAEPDICREVFYALDNVLWPQIQKQSDASFKDAWMNFIGSSSMSKGFLSPPEKLITKQPDFDQVIDSIVVLKQKINEFVDQKEEILASLNLVQEFYSKFQSKIKESFDPDHLLQPKAVMMGDIFNGGHWAYRIPKNTAQKLLSFTALPEGSETSEPLVYFKANRRPDKEFMLSSLYRCLNIPVRESALLVITNLCEENQDDFFTVQASEAVIGKSALEVFQDTEIIFEEEAYSLQTIGALLATPSDYSFRNFKYSPVYKTLISIENSSAFQPELTGKTLNMKSILHLLSLMDKPVPKNARAYFTPLDANLLALAWLQDLSKKNKEYQLLTQRCGTEINLRLKISVSKDLLKSIVDKLQKIERILLNSPSASIQALFEGVSPLLGRHYKMLRSTFNNDPHAAFLALSGESQNDNGIDYSSLLGNENEEVINDIENLEDVDPEMHLEYVKNLLSSSSSQTPLDSLIRRHREKKRKNLLNLQDVLKELLLLIQENLTDSKSPRDIVDFMYDISTMIHPQQNLAVEEINALLSSLPHEELQWLLTVEKHFVRATHDVPSDKRTSSLTFSGAFMKKRIFVLSETEKRSLLDQLKNNKKTSNDAFYLKQDPESPGYEFASTSFMRLLGITRLPHQDLLVISQSPVLLTQKVVGQSPQAHQFDNLDPSHTALLIISAILTNSEYWKEDCFILSEDGRYLTPIKNDQYFVSSAFQKNLLFCLDEMKEFIPFEVQQRILLMNFDDLLTSWITGLIKVDDRYNHLIEEKIDLRIRFEEQFIHNVYWKARKIQYILRKGPEVTPFDLLKAVEPSLFQLYQKPFQKETTLQDRFKSVLKANLQGDRMSIFNLPGTIGPIDALEILSELIQESKLPEKELDDSSFFENILKESDLENFFRNPKEVLLLRGSQLIKKEKLEVLLELRPDKGARFRFMAFPKSPLLTSAAIRTLIGGCPNLEYLDVSGCAKLDTISIEKGEWPFLARLEAQECPVLEKLACFNHIQTLKIGSSSKIGVSTGEHCPDNISVTIKTHDHQFNLYFKKGQGFEINDSKDEKLTNKDFILFGGTIFDSYFKDLTITLGGFTMSSGKDLGVLIPFLDFATQELTNERTEKIAGLNLRNVERVNLSECVLMESGILSCLVKGDWPNLKYLNLSMIELDNADFSILSLGKWSLLEELHLQRTKMALTGIEAIVMASNWPQLKVLNVSFNEIHDEGLFILSRENWSPLLETLDLSHTRGTRKGLLNFLLNFKRTHLKQAYFAPWEVAHKNFVNQLLPINWPFLGKLDLSKSEISTAQLKVIRSEWPQLKHLDLSDNEIAEEGFSFLALGEWPLLEELHLENTKLTNVGIEMIVEKSNWPQLKHLDISNNDDVFDEGLERLSRGNWPRLEILDLNLTRATKKGLLNLFLNLHWPKLKHVTFMYQELADQLLPSKWALLEKIDLSCTGDQTKGIVEKFKWPQLKYLDLSNNGDICDETIEVLSRGNWPLLETLDLSRTKVTKRGLLSLVLKIDWPNLKEIIFGILDNINKTFVDSLLPINWPSLQRLNLGNIGIRQSDIIKIVKKSNWTQLKSLILCDNDMTDEDLLILSQGNWPLLETLDLSRTKITTRGLLNFLINGNWANLKGIIVDDDNGCLISSLLPIYWPLLSNLDLKGLEITQEEINTIVKKANWPKLKYLTLSDNDIGDKGLEILSQGSWPLLEKLHLENTNITVEGFEIMLKNANWPNLKELHLDKLGIISKLIFEKWPQVRLFSGGQL